MFTLFSQAKSSLIRSIFLKKEPLWRDGDSLSAHCLGTLEGCIPTALCYAFDGITDNLLRETLLDLGFGTLPFWCWVGVYAYYHYQKLEETAENHPKYAILELEYEQLSLTTGFLLAYFRAERAEARRFLSQEKFGISENEIDYLLSDDEAQPLDDYGAEGPVIKRYQLLQKLYTASHGEPTNAHALMHALLHCISNWNPILLLKYFADINLVKRGSGINLLNSLGFTVVLGSLVSAVQSFFFTKTPQAPSAADVSECLNQGFLKYRQDRLRLAALTSSAPVPRLFSDKTKAVLEDFAKANRAEKCHFNCQ